jgi:hypothetical protein|tara:strand:- start:18275 stop:18538 length:264 start_codon:yes stop_codon:yes gene_type:complete
LDEGDFWEGDILGFCQIKYEGYPLFGNGEDFRLGAVSKAIEDRDPLVRLNAEDLGEVLGFVAFKKRSFCPGRGGEVGAGHEEVKSAE